MPVDAAVLGFVRATLPPPPARVLEVGAGRGELAAALREVGYDGIVSVEVFKFEEGAEVIATGSIEYLRRAFAT